MSTLAVTVPRAITAVPEPDTPTLEPPAAEIAAASTSVLLLAATFRSPVRSMAVLATVAL